MSTVENDLANHECESSSYEIEHIAKERFIEGGADGGGFTIEDVDAALEWHFDETGGSLVLSFLANWHGVDYRNTDKVEQKAAKLRELIDEIMAEYAEQVMWPKHKKALENGDHL